MKFCPGPSPPQMCGPYVMHKARNFSRSEFCITLTVTILQIEIKEDQDSWSSYYALDSGELNDFKGVPGRRDSYLHDEIFRLMELRAVLEELGDRAKAKGVTIAG